LVGSDLKIPQDHDQQRTESVSVLALIGVPPMKLKDTQIGLSVNQSLPEDLMDAHDVSAIVNSAKYDGPECIRPVADDEMPRSRQLSLL